MKRILLMGSIFFFSVILGQEKNFNAGGFLEKHFPENYNEYHIELIENLYESKIDLNTLSYSDKAIFFFVKESLVDEIINYRKQKGRFLSIKELYEIPDVNPNEINLLVPFLKVVTNEEKENRSLNFLPLIISRSRYISKNISTDYSNYYSRVKAQHRNYEFSLIHNGFASGKNFKLQNYSFKLMPHKNLPVVTGGKYSINFGFGLSLWGPYKMFKGIYYKSIKRSKAKIRMHQSVAANNALNGIAVKLSYNNLTAKLFYSKTQQDFTEKHIGGIIQYQSPGFQIDFLVHKIISPQQSNLNFSISGTGNFHNFIYENEINYLDKKVSHLHTLRYKPSKSMTLFYSIRNYNNLANSKYANPLRESSSLVDEFGQIFCVEFAFENNKLIFFFDKYNKASKINSGFQLYGLEFSGRFTGKLSSKSALVSEIKYEEKDEFGKTSEQLFLHKSKILRVKNKFHYKIKDKFKIAQRIDLSTPLIKDVKPGYALTTECDFTISKIFEVKTSFMVYQTEKNVPAIYIYEYDLPGLFLTKQLTGEGIYWYSLINVNLHNKINISLKYSEQRKESNYSEGYFSEVKKDFRMQIDLKL